MEHSIRSRYAKGRWAEDLACAYLCQHGLCSVARNYRYRNGEIDLVMQQRDVLVFVEVRYRNSQQYGGSLESINVPKQQRLLATAAHYLQTHSEAQAFACRFDAVLIEGTQKTPQIQWIKDAFRG